VITPELPVEAVVSQLALAKAQEVASRHRGSLIIAADTLVALDAEVFGKPLARADAMRMLRAMSGRSHRVVSGLVALDADSMHHVSRVVETEVHFRALAEAEIDAYVRTGEPLDKAGAYGLQDLGAVFVERVDGDPYNVIGLPLVALNEVLQGFGACILCRRPRVARD
jgi:septum formation protein